MRPLLPPRTTALLSLLLSSNFSPHPKSSPSSIPAVTPSMAEEEERKADGITEEAEEEKEAEALSGNKKMRHGACGWLRERRVRELVREKRRLVEVPHTATLSDTVNALLANRVTAVPVAAPPGHWIGAGGSMILESDRATGAVRKHYIGMVTMLDVLAHIADAAADPIMHDGESAELERRMVVPVSSVIGHSLEGLSLWTMNPNTSVLDCMETLSKGVHRALVPVESQAINDTTTVELVEASPGYRMLTQMDVLGFLRQQSHELKDILSHNVDEVGAISETVFAVEKHAAVIDVIKSMRAAGLSAVPVVEAPSHHQVLQDGKGKKLVETFSATDLRGCPMDLLQSWLGLTVTEFKERLGSTRRAAAAYCGGDDDWEAAAGIVRRRLVACTSESSVLEVVELAVSNHVHRVWVVEGEMGLLRGLVSLTDMLRVVRQTALREEHRLEETVVS